jgi:hypothetical protein
MCGYAVILLRTTNRDKSTGGFDRKVEDAVSRLIAP